MNEGIVLVGGIFIAIGLVVLLIDYVQKKNSIKPPLIAPPRNGERDKKEEEREESNINGI